MGGGGSKWTEEYIKGLPTTGDADLLYDRTDRSSPVRVGRKVYEFSGGGRDGAGGWEPVFTIPDDYETSGTVPGTESPDGAIPTISRTSGTSGTSGYASNPFFPQLVPEYTPQGLLDWSEYMPEGGMFGHEQYQPWTNPNSIPDNIFNYQPPTIHAGSGIRGGGSSGGSGGGSGGGYSGGYIPTGHIEVAGSPSTTGIGIIDDHVPPAGDGPDRDWGGADVDTQSPDLAEKRSNPGGASYPTTTPAHYPTDLHPPLPTVPVGPAIGTTQGFIASPAFATQINRGKELEAQIAAINAAENARKAEERELAELLANISTRYGSSDHQQDMAEQAMGKAMADYERDFPAKGKTAAEHLSDYANIGGGPGTPGGYGGVGGGLSGGSPHR
jgi:hypothetical protein